MVKATEEELADMIEERLQENYGSGTRISIAIQDGKEPQEGLIYGNDECIGDQPESPHYGKLCQYFQPDGSTSVYECWYAIPEGETDLGNIDYSNPDEIELSDLWRCQ